MTPPDRGRARAAVAALPDRLVDRFDLLLVAIIVSVVFTMAAPTSRWGLLTALALQAGVLVVALRIAVAGRRLLRVGWVAGAGVVLVALGLEATDLAQRNRLIAALAVVLVLAAMAAIVVRLLRRGRVDGRTVLGAVCLYLLLGTLFTFAFGAVSGGDGFFAEEPTTLSSLQYFSLVTLTTVGYGDLTPVTRIGRSLAVVEALLGQIYLVTVVALLVGRLGGPTDGPRPTDGGTPA